MVGYDYIIKAIDNELRKSHQRLSVHLSFSEVEHTFDEFHNQTCKDKKLKKEKGILCNNKGERLMFFRRGKWRDVLNGTSSSVSEWDVIDVWNHHMDEGDLHFTHNHPRDGKDFPAECLSLSDITLLVHNRIREDANTGKYYEDFLLKSMSCESSNGSRMTLTRGDKFTSKNEGKALSLGRDLEDCWRDYIMKYRAKKIQVLENAPSDVLRKSRNEIDQYVIKQTMKELGTFDKSPVFKEIQRDFRNIDCSLEISYPDDFIVNY